MPPETSLPDAVAKLLGELDTLGPAVDDGLTSAIEGARRAHARVKATPHGNDMQRRIAARIARLGLPGNFNDLDLAGLPTRSYDALDRLLRAVESELARVRERARRAPF